MPRRRSEPPAAAPPLVPLPAGPVNPYILACAWKGAEGPCLLPGELGRGRRDGDEFFCGWHGQTVILGRDAGARDDRAAFERWLAGHFHPYPYCCVWTHHDAAELWLAVQGLRALGPARPCSRPDCRRPSQIEAPF